MKRVLAPVVIPPRLDDDLHYVERKFPKAAKQRAKLKETGSDIDRLRAEAVAATKLVNKANTDILRAEKRRDFLRNELANLVFQDDIVEKRRRRGELIEEEKERLEEREQEIRECVLVRGLVWFGLVGLVGSPRPNPSQSSLHRLLTSQLPRAVEVDSHPVLALILVNGILNQLVRRR